MSEIEQEKNPEQIREEIEDTREELGDTVAAVAAKTDVKGQAQAKVDEIKGQAHDKVDEVKEQASAAAEETKAKARQNPAPFAIAGALVAVLILRRLLRR